MSEPVPTQPTNVQLRRLVVGNPVSSQHLARWGDELAFLLAGVGECVADVSFANDVVTSSAFFTSVAYARSPGCQVLLVLVEFNNVAPSWNSGRSATIQVKRALLPTTWVTAGPPSGGRLDGTGLIALPDADLRNPPFLFGYIDVTSMTPGVIEDIELHWTPNGVNSAPMRFKLVEVPLALVAPEAAPTTEVGVSSGWTFPGQPIDDGSPSLAVGMQRVLDQYVKSRSLVKRHIQHCMLSFDPADTVSVNPTYGDFNWRPSSTFWSGTFVPFWYTFVRRLYAPATNGNAYTFRVVANTTAVGGGSVKLTAVGVGGGTTTFVAAVPQGSSSSDWRVASVTGYLPTNATTPPGEVKLQVQGWTNDGTQSLRLLNWALIENEA